MTVTSASSFRYLREKKTPAPAVSAEVEAFLSYIATIRKQHEDMPTFEQFMQLTEIQRLMQCVSESIDMCFTLTGGQPFAGQRLSPKDLTELTKLRYVGLSVRAYNCLRSYDHVVVKQVWDLPDTELANYYSCGSVTFLEIRTRIGYEDRVERTTEELTKIYRRAKKRC